MKYIFTKITITLLLILSFSIFGQWQKANGPYGGRIIKMSCNGDKIVAATLNGGLFITSDNGNTWNSLNESPKDIIALDYFGNTIFASIDSNLYCHSISDSLWTPIIADSISSPIVTIGSCSTFTLVGTNNSIYSSSDTGSSWKQVNFPDTSILSIKIVDTRVYVRTIFHLYLSTDTCKNWELIDNGLPDDNLLKSGAFFVTGGKIYVGTSSGLYVSNNNGNTWSKLGLDNFILEIYGESPNIFVSTSQGVNLSKDNGLTFNQINTGLTDPLGLSNINIYSIIKSNNTFVAGSWRGAFLFDPLSNSWKHSVNGLSAEFISNTASIGNTLIAGTLHDGIFITEDNGINWKKSNNGFGSLEITALKVFNNTAYTSNNKENLRSVDSGNTWTKMDFPTSPWINEVNKYGKFKNYVIAGTKLTEEIFISPDSGITWNSTTKIPYPDILITTCFCSNDTILFIGTNKGFFYTTDTCKSYNPMNNGLSNLSIRSCCLVDSLMFAGTDSGIVTYNLNNSTWTNCNNGITPTYITDIISYNKNIFAGTIDSGILLSEDNGISWKYVNDGLTNFKIQSITIHNDNLFVGTMGSGVSWHRPLREMVSITPIYHGSFQTIKSTNLKITVRNKQCFIQNTLHASNLIKLSIYSLSGKLIDKKVSTHSSKKDKIISSKKLSSGTYLISAHFTNGKTLSQKIHIH